MAQSINVSISIEDETINVFSSIKIVQSVHTHHTFELLVPFNNYNSTSYKLLEQSKSYLGKNVHFQFSPMIFEKKYSDNEFNGIITDVGIASFHGDKHMRISGYSPTILLEGKGQYKSFLEVPLKEMVDSMLEKIPRSVKTKINPDFTGILPYAVQYNESNYAFLQRMAARYGEWCYYDGLKLVFGKFSEEKTIALAFGNDLQGLEYSVKMLHTQEKATAYNYKEDEIYTHSSSAIPDNVDDAFARFALDQSKNIFMQEPLMAVNGQVDTKKDIEAFLRRRKENASREMVIAKGISDLPYLSVGAVINITGDTIMEDDFGKMIVTSVTHVVDNTSSYQNSFTAIPFLVKTAPASEVTTPQAQIEPAIVTDNKDPLGLGRVQVRFFWQQSGETSPWIRVASALAGSAEDKTYGFYFIPEIKDKVLIQYEHNNPDMPFVLSGMYHKNSSPSNWKHEKNDLKIIRTRSGNQILFDDNDKQEIRISNTDSKDPKNYISLILGERGKITIKSNGELLLDADSIKMVAKKGIEIEGNTVDIKSTLDTCLKALMINLN